MKKILVLVLTMVFAVSICACGADNKKNGGDIEITMPAMLLGESTADEIVASAKEKGYIDCTINEDGSVTYKVTKKQQKEMLNDVKKTIDKSISEVMDSAQIYTSFKEIKYSDDMSKFDIFVDGDSFGMFDSLAAVLFYLDGAMYQTIQGKSIDSIDVVVNFIDAETNEVLNSASYKDWITSQ